MAVARCVFPLPTLNTRLPRKHKQRLYRELILSLLLLLSLTLIIRHHYHPHRNAPNSTRLPIHPKHTPQQLSAIPRNIYYMRFERIMYCYIPKNACSRFKPLLRKREGFANWNDSKLIHGKRNGLRRLQWLSHEKALRMLHDRRWKKFVVIRDPFARLISAYQNKIATPWPDQRADFWHKHLQHECPGMLSSLQMPTNGPLMSLEQFLQCLLSDDKTDESNEHWRPQTQLCGLDHIHYDRYLQLERLAEDVTDLLRYLGWTEESLQRFRMTKNPVYSRDLAAYFSQRTLEMALTYYKKDFEILRYTQAPQGIINFYSVFDGSNFQPGFETPVNDQPLDVNNTTTNDGNSTVAGGG